MDPASLASPDGSEELEPTDGRVARGLRTREAILSAYEELIQDAELPPIGADLAARAGVSARSIFTHFGDMDGVLAAAARRALAWVVETHEPIAADLPLAERLDRFVARQSEVLERTAPIHRMVRSVRQGSRREGCPAAVLDILQTADAVRRRYLGIVFDWEIGSRPGSDEGELMDALMVSTSWGAWEALCLEQQLDPDDARRVMRRLLASLLD